MSAGARSRNTLIRRLEVNLKTLNPVCTTRSYDQYVHQYLYTPLIELDKQQRPVPGLAKSWEIMENGRRYRFVLHENATFSDGRPVLATDVVFTLRKIVDRSHPAAHLVGSFAHLDLDRTRALDDHTLDVAFTQPLATQLTRFADVLVVPANAYANTDPCSDTSAIGSGPYQLVSQSHGSIVMKRRDEYWRERPPIQTVIFKVITDHATAWKALQRDEIDETIVTSDTWHHQRASHSRTRNIVFQQFYTPGYNFIAWNCRHPILQDKRVRRALAMCVPVDAAVRDLYHDTARRITGPFTPDQDAYNHAVQPIPYAPKEAQRVLRSIGWADHDGDGVLEKKGTRLSLSLLIMAGNASAAQFAQLIREELLPIGVRIEIDTVDSATASERIRAGNYDAAYLGWDLDAEPDPYAKFHSSQIPPHGQNVVFYTNPRVDQLIQEARTEFDHLARARKYRQLHAVLAEDQPYTWTVQAATKWAINKRVHGVQVSPLAGPFLWNPGELGWSISPDGSTPTQPARR